MKLFTTLLFFLCSGMILLTGCYYDNEETLYPQTVCDTTNVTYSGTIVPILQSNSCLTCHDPVTASGGVILQTYADLLVYVQNGKFWGAVSHASGYFPMPNGGNKLSDCDLTKIDLWIKKGAPNN
jgi:hypothetical protein